MTINTKRVHGYSKFNKMFVHGGFVGTNGLHYKYSKGKITDDELVEILFVKLHG